MPNPAEPAPASVPADKKAQWEQVYKSAFSAAKKNGKTDKDAESQAFAEANGVIKKETKSMSEKPEVRFLQNVEVRMTGEGKIAGLIPYNSRSENLGGFSEIIRPGAFQEAISGKEDVRALFNHNPSCVLGRNKSGTLNLRDTAEGMEYEITPPEAQWARDLSASISRRDITGASFGFVVNGDDWKATRSEKGDMETTRYLNSVRLFDVGPVTFPAYASATANLRALWPDGMPEEVETHIPELRMVVHMPGHKDSQGKDAPWVIKQEGTGKIIASFATEEEAKKQLKVIESIKHGEKNSLRDLKDAKVQKISGHLDADGDPAPWCIVDEGKVVSHFESEADAQQALKKLQSSESKSLQAVIEELRAVNKWLRGLLAESIKQTF
jgi:HK97 family phage prohead protease